MQELLKKYLFSKNIFVCEGEPERGVSFSVMLSLAKLFNIKVVDGCDLAKLEHVRFASEMLGEKVTQPFYTGFPKSVLELGFEERLLNQLRHYYTTYWLGDFVNPGQAEIEECFDRTALKEPGVEKKFYVLTQEDAVKKLEDTVEALLKSTRPLSNSAYKVVLTFIQEYGYEVKACPCKDTAMQLLLDTKEEKYADFFSFSDIIRLAEYVNYTKYESTNLKKLNWKNQDRKQIAKVLDRKLANGECNLRECFEKQALWCGLLHHIHYEPKCPLGEQFVHAMREEKNSSVYSAFEAAILQADVKQALNILREGKGAGAVIRHLNYLLSRCESQADVDYVLENMGCKNPVLLIQLYIQYANSREEDARIFKFTKYNMLKLHKETSEEISRRKSGLPADIRDKVAKKVVQNLQELYQGKLGCVYIDEAMKKIALPIQETAGMGGFGILPKGSRLFLQQGNILRGFTYWEKVNDIDLSVMGLSQDGRMYEFSWRTMVRDTSPAIVYSGDQTSGYKGGSEYFDIDIEKFRSLYPDVRYLVFSNNVYSRIPFSECICKAGYMIREEMNSGEVFEPKTVASSFAITCDSTFAYLFAIDLETEELVWLNIAKSGSTTVAGETTFDFLFDYFKLTDIINVYDLFAMMAKSVTTDPMEADVVVTDAQVSRKEGSVQVRSCDTELIVAYMNA